MSYSKARVIHYSETHTMNGSEIWLEHGG
jgi:hypothetical protein